VELYIIRHGIAVEREDFKKKGLEDHFRPLTLKGRKRMQKVAIRLRDFVEDIDVLISSPLVRARQTAEILSQIYFDLEIIEAAELVPQSPPQAFVKWLRVHGRSYKKIAIVGHEPHLSNLASYLLSGEEGSFIDLRKSGVLCLEIEDFATTEPGSSQLVFSVPPRMLADLR